MFGIDPVIWLLLAEAVAWVIARRRGYEFRLATPLDKALEEIKSDEEKAEAEKQLGALVEKLAAKKAEKE